MKYGYKGVTGKTVIEVDEQFFDILIALDNDESNNDRKHSRRHPVSLENTEYEGEWFADGTDILGDLIRAESSKRLYAALAELSPDQRSLIQQIYFEGAAPSEIARREGVYKSTISNRLDRVYKRLKKLLE